MPAPPHVHHLTVTRTARVVTAGADATARTTLLALHGYAQLAEELVEGLSPLLAGVPSLRIVAPEGLSRFYRKRGSTEEIGASWMTRVDRLHEIDDYLAYLDTVARDMIDPAHRLILLGFSQGTATAGRWALHRAGAGNPPPRHLVLWGSLLSPEIASRPDSLRTLPPTTFLHGSDDPLVRREEMEGQREALRAAGTDVEMIEYEGGHRILPAGLEQLAHIVAAGD